MLFKILIYKILLPVQNLGGAFAPLPDAGYGPGFFGDPGPWAKSVGSGRVRSY